MTATRTVGHACGKVILFGEHAVVYGRPAIAVPVTQVAATATVEGTGQRITLVAPDLGRRYPLDEAGPDDPLAFIVATALEYFGFGAYHGLTITVRSTIPVARGLGSSAAISAAIVRALAQHFGRDLALEEVSELVYRAEVLQHGTPSGIDNSVVAVEQPVYFVRQQPIERIHLGGPLHLVIADTGIASSTREVVGAVRAAWERDRIRYDGLFEQIGHIAQEARTAIEEGAAEQIGRLMDANHALLQAIGVSSPELDRLVEAARSAGALGAKLSGAGRGGNIIALVRAEAQETVVAALRVASAHGVIVTSIL